MKTLKEFGGWLLEKFDDNLGDLKENVNLIIDYKWDVLFSLIIMWLGFYTLLKTTNDFIIILYLLTVIWITLFNTLVLVEKPNYFYFTLLIILFSNNFGQIPMGNLEKNIFMGIIYLGVWIALRIKMNRIRGG